MSNKSDGRAGASSARSGSVLYALYAACASLVLVDPLIHKHGPFAIEHVWGFYGFYGFIACAALLLAAKLMRVFLKRDEDYYDR